MAITVFDLHCDTLDRLVFSADPSVPGGFYEHDAGVPRDRMSRLDVNDAHISLEHMQSFDWCQCFAVYVPDTVCGAEAWSLFGRAERFWRAELARCGERIVQVRGSSETAEAFKLNKVAGMLTVEGLSFLEDDASADARLDALVDAGVRMATLTWNGVNALGSGHGGSGGLTAFGRRMVRALEERGIVADASFRVFALQCARRLRTSAQPGGLATPRDRRTWRRRGLELLQRVSDRLR